MHNTWCENTILTLVVINLFSKENSKQMKQKKNQNENKQHMQIAIALFWNIKCTTKTDNPTFIEITLYPLNMQNLYNEIKFL